MPERFLRECDIAAMLGTSPGVAASILAGKGIHPIDFGVGRGRGRRWLESAVQQAMLEMHAAAQPRPRHPRAATAPSCKLAGMSADDVYRLTTGRCVQ